MKKLIFISLLLLSSCKNKCGEVVKIEESGTTLGGFSYQGPITFVKVNNKKSGMEFHGLCKGNLEIGDICCPN